MVKKITLLAYVILLLASCATSHKSATGTQKVNLENIQGTYHGVTRLADGRVDIDKLIYELNDLNANTYNWLIWLGKNDWDDLQLFLPKAQQKNINVWVTLVPPSESKPMRSHSSEPFQMDYIKWAKEIGALSLQYKNLTALSIDDYVGYNLQLYTPGYTDSLVSTLKSINPTLAFVPCVYYRSGTVPGFAALYDKYFDAILFPYKGEATGKETLATTSTFKFELDSLRKLFRPGIPFIVDIYSTKHSKTKPSTPEYVEEMIHLAKKYANGVFIYKHPGNSVDADKYPVIKKVFGNYKK